MSIRTQPNRLQTGGLVDKSRSISFTFDGKRYTGHPGDTLASALLANGVTLVGRSFKYHRPRGIMSAGSEEPNALVELRDGARREPNTRMTVVDLFDGLKATSQNRWPSLAFDAMSINSLLSPLFVAGFYYKTFMWPAALWEKLYEPMIRRAAGLGRASDDPDPDTYEKVTAFADVLVIAAGLRALQPHFRPDGAEHASFSSMRTRCSAAAPSMTARSWMESPRTSGCAPQKPNLQAAPKFASCAGRRHSAVTTVAPSAPSNV